jgi:F-type H+-transporting ATPase subunit b
MQRMWLAVALGSTALTALPQTAQAADEGILSPRFDLGIWTIVIFVALLLILRKFAWGPLLEGLTKREQSIREAVEEAKKARDETARVTAEFKAKMDQAYAEIPKMMDEARRDAQNLAEEMRAKANQDIQTERARLRREIDIARDQALQELWNQAAQLATLISAKAIGRSLSEDDHRRLVDEALGEMGARRG